MESESANLESQIQMQQEGVEAKDAEMRRIREQIHQVLLSVLRPPVSAYGSDNNVAPHADDLVDVSSLFSVQYCLS